MQRAEKLEEASKQLEPQDRGGRKVRGRVGVRQLDCEQCAVGCGAGLRAVESLTQADQDQPAATGGFQGSNWQRMGRRCHRASQTEFLVAAQRWARLTLQKRVYRRGLAEEQIVRNARLGE